MPGPHTINETALAHLITDLRHLDVDTSDSVRATMCHQFAATQDATQQNIDWARELADDLEGERHRLADWLHDNRGTIPPDVHDAVARAIDQNDLEIMAWRTISRYLATELDMAENPDAYDHEGRANPPVLYDLGDL